MFKILIRSDSIYCWNFAWTTSQKEIQENHKYKDSYTCIHVFRSNSELFQDPWEILFDEISLNRIIGEGAFGKVYSGRLMKQTMEVGKGRISSQCKTDKEQQEMKMGLAVAVKMLQSMICLCQLFLTYKIAVYSFGLLLRRRYRHIGI